MYIKQLLFIFFIEIVHCASTFGQVPHFQSSTDTLIIPAKKIKGLGMFPAGAGQIYFKDTTERYEYPVIFPKNISEIKLALKHVDIKPFRYKNLKESHSDYMTTFLDENFPEKFDTSNIASVKENTICIMSGKLGNENIFIVDENNNKDFRDDSVRLYNKMDWHTKDHLIQCKYEVFSGGKMHIDSTWVNIGELGGNLLFFVSHHLVTEFTIDKENYQLGIVDEQSNFCFDDPIFALTAKNGFKKDTLLKTELLKKGEYVKLKNKYYRFDDISNDGRQIILIKERDFNSKIGTQVGMIAPSYLCKTTDGDSINSKNLNGQFVLIANISGCTPASYSKYKELIELNKDKIFILGVESGLKKKLGGKIIDVEEAYNKDFFEKYRQDYSCYDCYLIDPKGRISDKFNIFNWEKNLKHFKENKE